MKSAPFDYVRAETVAHALEELSADAGDAVLLAGGQTLMPLLALRMSTASRLIDIHALDALAGVTRGPDGTRIGATTRQNAILADPLVTEHVPALARATRFVGHHQTRNRGTIGGSLGLAEPAAEYPCVALTMGALIEVASVSGTRTIAADDFFVGPYTTAVAVDEMITAVTFPDWPRDTLTIVHEVARRPGDFALVGLICALAVEGGAIRRAAVGWFGMGPTPMRSRRAEAAMTGQAIATLDLAAAARLAIEDTDPLTDVHADAGYRRVVGERIFQHVLAGAILERRTHEFA